MAYYQVGVYVFLLLSYVELTSGLATSSSADFWPFWSFTRQVATVASDAPSPSTQSPEPSPARVKDVLHAQQKAAPSASVAKAPARAKQKAAPSASVAKAPAQAKMKVALSVSGAKAPAQAKQKAAPSVSFAKAPAQAKMKAAPSVSVAKAPAQAKMKAAPSVSVAKAPAHANMKAAPSVSVAKAPAQVKMKAAPSVSVAEAPAKAKLKLARPVSGAGSPLTAKKSAPSPAGSLAPSQTMTHRRLRGTKAARKPNIIWVMADDLGWGEVGVYPASSERLRIATPSLDKFAHEGIRFMHAYSGYSVCAPSRTAFFTGLHAGRFRKHNLTGITMGPESKVLNLAQMLQGAGYWTGAIGKISPFEKPLSQGFDRFIGKVDQTECHDMYPAALDQGNSVNNFPLKLNAVEKNRELCMMHPERFSYSMDVFHDKAVNWVQERARIPETPFFLYLAYTVPHAGGYHGSKTEGNPVPSNILYQSQTWHAVEKDHAAVITYMDSLFGDLMDTIRRAGIDNNTIVFFASDNGAHQEGGHNHEYFNSTGGLRGMKRSVFEGGVRSPSMVRWPGHIEGDRISHLAWAFWDVLPTLADIVGYDYSVDDDMVDSISIAPTLFRTGEQPLHKFLYFTWNGGYAIRIGKFKGVVEMANVPLIPRDDDPLQLFDLHEDPFETVDVSKENQGTVEHMLSLIHAIDDGHCFQCYFRKEWIPMWEAAGLDPTSEV